MINGFTRRKEQSKEDIRMAAWELFGQFGVEKVSVADIAHKAGVSQATIYNNFGSKEALAREFVSSAVEQLVNSVQLLLTNDRPYWDRVTSVIQFISEMLANSHPSRTSFANLTSDSNLLNDPDIKKLRDVARERMEMILMDLIKEGKENGHISPGLSDDACRLYFTAFLDIFVDPRVHQMYFRNPGLIQDLGALMMFGLSGQK
ncbi:MAG: TetR/AcrR family transcriptional regulator [Anaerolineae bacterium]|nr:TetR/AcrR family transcriptional regulator [Anaerolineae bacterium]